MSIGCYTVFVNKILHCKVKQSRFPLRVPLLLMLSYLYKMDIDKNGNNISHNHFLLVL